jgi:hypothetical protein
MSTLFGPLTLAGILDRYLFENPWPLVVVLLVVAIALGWKGLTEGDAPKRNVALVLAGLAAAAGLAGSLVTTAAEEARAVVERLVAHATSGDTAAMLAELSPNCLLHYGRPENPGVQRSVWEPSLGLLRGQYSIESNRITALSAESVSSTAATVELSNATVVSIFGAPMPNSWWFRVAKQPDGTWKIERIAALRIGRDAPTPGMF